jgi:hypothetical protein
MELDWANFAKKNPPGSDSFTFIFPKELVYYNYIILLAQLNELLNKIECPFNNQTSILGYYNKLFKIGYNGTVEFDLSETEYLGNLEILMLHILGDFCHKLTDQKVILKISKSNSLLDILIRWNFFEHFEDWGKLGSELNVNIFQPRKDSNVLLPIRKISKHQDVGSTIDKMTRKKVKKMLERDWGMDENVIDYFSMDVLSEICDNIPRHSKSDGFIMVHAHPQLDMRRPNIEIAISDGGIGIKQSLYDRYPSIYANSSNYEVVNDVLKGDFPYPRAENHGGIFRARRFVDEFQGKIFIRSICAKAGNFKKPQEKDRNWKFFPGTHVNIMIPRIKNQNMQERRDRN